MGDFELANRVFDAISDGYDDEEQREEVVNEILEELELLHGKKNLRACLEALCELVEEMSA